MATELIPQPHGGALRGPWQPGQAGNGRGRPKGLMARVQAKCGRGRDGKKLVDGLFAIAFGTAAQRTKLFGEDVEVTTRDRLAAIDTLLDRGWGKAFVPDDDDIPFVPATSNTGPTLVFNIPRPAKELVGRTVVYDDEKEPNS